MSELNGDFSHIGQVLKNARLSHNLTEAEVAARLNLFTSQVKAIEEGNFQRLHGETFVMGYLRNYARVVDADGEALVQAFHAAKPQPEETTEIPEISAQGRLKTSFQLKQHKTMLGVALSAILAVNVWYFNTLPEPERNTAPINVVTVDTAKGTTIVGPLEEYTDEEIEVGSSASQLTQNESVAARSVQNASSGAEEDLAASAGSGAENSKSINNEQIASVASQYSERATYTIEAGGQSQLSFYFTGDCWVEVQDGDSRLIYANLKRADDSLQLTGKPPFKVILGYAPAVSLSYNGEPVNIETNQRNNMARLVLGNS